MIGSLPLFAPVVIGCGHCFGMGFSTFYLKTALLKCFRSMGIEINVLYVFERNKLGFIKRVDHVSWLL